MRIALLLVLSTALGCSPERLRNDQLARVAKDWSLVIRASQVIPVYPLTEDLQPGDVLLVSLPIEDQVRIYEEKGFLPLDQHLVRLDLAAAGFQAFYGARYGLDANAPPPGKWQAEGWAPAPRAAFPSYQFSVRTGAGLSLAIPVSGIPFALGLMSSGRASGTVTIADAYTYGLDNVRAEKLVTGWAGENRALLRGYAPRDGRHHFLRVITRVFAAGRVAVTVTNDEAKGGTAGAGADRPVDLLGLEEGSAGENYAATLKRINELAATQLPGGKLQIGSASSRSVSLSETFARPLVVGYVGFDLPVLEGGRLGAPISTLAQLSRRESFTAVRPESAYRLAALAHMDRALSELTGPEAEAVRGRLDLLAERLPERYPFQPYELAGAPEEGGAVDVQPVEEVRGGGAVERAHFSDLLAYLGYARETVVVLERHLSRAPRSTDAERHTVAALERELGGARESLERIGAALNGEPALLEAIDLVFLGSE